MAKSKVLRTKEKKNYEEHLSSSNTSANLVSVVMWLAPFLFSYMNNLLYYLALIGLILVIVLEKKSEMVRLNAAKSFIVNLLFTLIAWFISAVVITILMDYLYSNALINDQFLATTIGTIELTTSILYIAYLVILIYSVIWAIQWKKTNLSFIDSLANKLIGNKK